MKRLPFEKLLIWQKAMATVYAVYDKTRDFPRTELYGLTAQMRGSAVSVASNIAEGSQRSTDRDFAHFLLMAKGSLAELKTQYYVAVHAKYISLESFQSFLQKIEELDKMLWAFHEKLTASRF